MEWLVYTTLVYDSSTRPVQAYEDHIIDQQSFTTTLSKKHRKNYRILLWAPPRSTMSDSFLHRFTEIFTLYLPPTAASHQQRGVISFNFSMTMPRSQLTTPSTYQSEDRSSNVDMPLSVHHHSSPKTSQLSDMLG